MEREEAIKIVKSHYPANKQMLNEALEFLIPELKESEDERIRKELIEFIKSRGGFKQEYIAWLEKQGNSSKECLNLPHFTFDDVLALQCCMETVKKVQEDKELYEQLQNLHNRLHDAYWLEKQGEKKPTDRVEPKFKVGDIVKFDRPSATVKREILSIDFENERYLTRRTDIGGAIKEFIYFCEQDDYVIVGSHNNNLSLETKVSILADEIIALKERVKALEIQAIRQCSDKAGDNVTLEDMKS